MIALDYRDARPIYSQIADGFREQIASGILSGGDRLPSVRELAGSLAINPNTIQRAYRELEAQGWIVSVGGKGCFVNDVPDIRQREKEELWKQFDKTMAALRAMGVSAEEIVDRVRKGGASNA